MVKVYNKGQRKIIFKENNVEKVLKPDHELETTKEVAEHLLGLFPLEVKVFGLEKKEEKKEEKKGK